MDEVKGHNFIGSALEDYFIVLWPDFYKIIALVFAIGQSIEVRWSLFDGVAFMLLRQVS